MPRSDAVFAGLSRMLAAAIMLLPLAMGPAWADPAGDKAVLDQLFAELRVAPDAPAAAALDQQIWHIWMAPGDPALAARMSVVLMAEQGGDLSSALVLLTRLVKDYPSYAEGWNQRATVEYQLGDPDASLADTDKVLALEPRHFGALSGRVLIYLAKGDRPKALQAMFAALAIHPFLSEQALFPELSQPPTEI